MSTQPSDDFACECREAFVNLCTTRNGINPNQPTARLQNQGKRKRLLSQIDDVLDAYLDWSEVEPWEAEMAAHSAATTPVVAPSELVVELPADDWRNW